MEFAKQAQLCVLYSIIMTTFIACQCESTSIEDHYRLHENLKLGNGGSILLRPANDVRYAVEVGLRFSPVHLVLDEAKQILTIRGMLELKWTDFRLQWNPRDFSGINETKIPLKKSGDFTIWTPEVVLHESVETDFASFQPETFKARLDYTGVVRWYTLAVTKSLCRLNHLCYPFDRQTCYLTFTTWAYQVSEQRFYHINDIFSNKKYKNYINDEGLWEIDIPPHTPKSDIMSYDRWYGDDEEYSFVKYTIELQRKQNLLYVFSLIFPCLVLSGATLATPFLEYVSDADPASFGLTCILTLMVFLTFVFATLPSSSQPLIGIFIVWLIVDALLVTLWAIKKTSMGARKTLDTNQSLREGVDQQNLERQPDQSKFGEQRNHLQLGEPPAQQQLEEQPDQEQLGEQPNQPQLGEQPDQQLLKNQQNFDPGQPTPQTGRWPISLKIIMVIAMCSKSLSTLFLILFIVASIVMSSKH